MKFFYAFDKVVSRIDKVLSYVAAAALLFISGYTVIDVVMRYFVNEALRGAQEVVEMAMPIMVYAAMTYAVRHKHMITVEFIVEKLSIAAQKIIECAMSVICSVTMFAMSVKLAERVGYYMSGTYTTYVAKIPYTPFYIFITICAFIMGIEFLISAVKDAMEAKNAIAENKKDKEAGK